MNQHTDRNNHLFLDADDIINDPLIIDDDDPSGLHEAQANLWTISISAEQAGQTAPAAVCALVRAVLEQREGQLLAQRGRDYPMLFYCWVDEMAGQLRFSLMRESPAGLPFGGQFRIIDRLETIAEQFLECPYLEGISWDELQPASWDDADPEPVSPALDVWAQRIPGSGVPPAEPWRD